MNSNPTAPKSNDENDENEDVTGHIFIDAKGDDGDWTPDIRRRDVAPETPGLRRE